ncbi:glycosyltransferase [Iamia sp. SCSIO 61187]|uniref:glycosyltransferase family 2 protein n=1 Tax=Iamia sp. SCSIO 61187 TaxID=2722752 RepID=UPI001C6326C0|nr:glycosyltransferase [Iamia sp. SCSIO 61187]QYG92123.1 glycosyltransferase [Iamia sp. SCSIO 61187]
MSDDDADTARPSPVERVRGFAARTRRLPGTVHALAASVDTSGEALAAELAELRTALDRIETLTWAGRHDTQGGVGAVGDELHRLRAHVDAVGGRVAALADTVAAQATAVGRTVEAGRRRAAALALRDRLGPAPELAPGLSVFTLCWNHGALLGDAVRSAQAVLDRLDPAEQGEILVLDDASTDRTPAVAAELAAADPRVRVIRSEVNLGLGHARSTLLHAARTHHALQLDADDLAVPAGAVDLYRAALRTGAAVTYGTVARAAGDGPAHGPVSNEPPSPAYFRSNYIGTIAVSDLAAYREIGGWPTDPLLEHVDDWASLQQLMADGRLVAFVPVLAAVYRQLSTGFHLSVPDHRLGRDRIARIFDPTGRHRGDDALAGVAAVALHPATGPLWATPEAIALDPSLAPTPPPPVRVATPTARVLLVGPGGVANLGDDAITVRGVERARDAFGPDVAIDVVTDGAPATALGGGSRWLVPLHVAVHGLDAGVRDGLPPRLAEAALRAGVDTARWRPCDPGAYDAAVFLGCGLSSRWAAGTMVPRALLAAALRRAGVPVALSGQSYEVDAADRDLLEVLLAGAAAVGARDEASAATATAVPGVDAGVVTLTGDDALGLAPVPVDGADSGSDGDRPVLAVTLRRAGYVGDGTGGDGADPVRRWALAADAVAAARGWDVLGVALNSQAPEPEIATLATLRATVPLRARWRLVDCGSDPARLVAAVAGARAVAAQSYHAALFGLAAGVPSVLAAATPYYEAKAGGLATLAGLPGSFVVRDPDDLAAALEDVEAALALTPAPLADAAKAADAWWSALPVAVGVAASP